MLNTEIDEELVLEQMKEDHNNDQVLQDDQDLVFACNTEEGQLICNVVLNYIKKMFTWLSNSMNKINNKQESLFGDEKGTQKIVQY